LIFEIKRREITQLAISDVLDGNQKCLTVWYSGCPSDKAICHLINGFLVW
jgi:hypothetical protein